MPRVEKVGNKPSEPSKILHMSLPDEQTLAFWKMTAEDGSEYADRVAKFSRALGGKAATNAPQSGRRWRDVASAPRSRRSDVLGTVLVMPIQSGSPSPSPRQRGQLRRAGLLLDGSSWRCPTSCNDRKTEELTQGGDVKAPGVQAGKRGKRMKRGAATQIMAYPRPKTKAVLVQASRDVNRPLSSFVLLSALTQAAALRGCEIKDLIPADELEQYRKSRVYRKRGKAAQ